MRPFSSRWGSAASLIFSQSLRRYFKSHSSSSNDAADAGGASDDAHPLRDAELVHRLAQLVAILALDAARDAAAPRVVRHQDEIAAGEADEGRQRGALVAALVLFDLNDDLGAFGDSAPGCGRGRARRRV